jgi:predicted tellurium resistance membrane protein TerC
MPGNSVVSLFAWAGQHHPLLQALAVIIGTFILEDAATVIAAMQADDGKLPTSLALLALYVGIILGDLASRSLHVGCRHTGLPGSANGCMDAYSTSC